MEDIHLPSDLLQESEPEEQGDADSVMILAIIAMAVLGIAWINYINLASSRALERAREVGVPKVVGRQKKQLVIQFLTESLMMNILVVFQFTASVALIAGTFLVHSQVRYMRNMDLGVSIDQKMVLRGPGNVNDTIFQEIYQTFKAEVNRIGGIDQLTSSSNIPGDEIFWASGIKRLDEEEYRGVMYVIGMDEDYIPAFDLELIAGRNFSPDYGTEDLAVILNRRAVDFLEFPTPEETIGKKVNFHGEERQIVGVIDDYHQMSLKQEPIPLLYRYLPASDDYFTMKVDPGQLGASLASLEETWMQFFEGNPFETFFLDEFFNRQYRIEKQLNTAVGFFALVAILIATQGLFGLSSFTTLQRTKEIGIRKVNGASPLTWVLIHRWLEGFPYQVPLHWWVFIYTGLIALVLALAAVSIQTLRAANKNPSESLKYE